MIQRNAVNVHSVKKRVKEYQNMKNSTRDFPMKQSQAWIQKWLSFLKSKDIIRALNPI